MQTGEADPRPIYVQIAEDLKSLILSRELTAEDRTPSTGEFSEFYRVSPATAVKVMTELSMMGLAERKKGLGMLVTSGARERIQAERREAFRRTYVEPLKTKTDALGLTFDNIITMLGGGK